MKKAITFLLFCFPFLAMSQNHTLSGSIKDARNGEVLIGASVYIADIKRGTTTNEFGFFSLELPQKASKVQFNFVGYTPQYRELSGNENVTVNIELKADVSLETLVITADSYKEQVQSTQMSVVRLTAI